MSTEPSTPTAPMSPAINNLQGSVWHRWDPHIHVPGTLLNDGYHGANPFEDFLVRIESSEPRIRALGITDYLSVELYEKVLHAKKAGRLADVDLVFANVEFRYNIGVAKGSAINAHLLISPDSDNHIGEIKRLLTGLEYHVGEDVFRCIPQDLIKLGRTHDPSVTNDKAALATGTNQFKVDPTQLNLLFKKSDWVRSNVILAISGNEDGTSGLQSDASLGSLRIEIERNARIIFSSNEKTREFWLGKGPATIDQLTERWGGPKPCIHGSDAHKNEDVGKPAGDRYTWIKGDLQFESLRQICFEPDERVRIQARGPHSMTAVKSVTKFSIENSDWFQPTELPLNPGLVAIIGARGSGKTAFADLIAVGGYSLLARINKGSFVERAKKLLDKELVRLTWSNSDITYNKVIDLGVEDMLDSPKIQYLSQQFVEDLCSAEGITDRLLEEVQKVVFQAHGIGDRMGASTFEELRDLKTAYAKNIQQNGQQSLADVATSLTTEYERAQNEKQIEKLVQETKQDIDTDKRSRSNLVSKGEKERIDELNDVAHAMDEVRKRLDAANRQHQALIALKAATSNLDAGILATQFDRFKSEHREAGLSDIQWVNFKMKFSGDVASVLIGETTTAKSKIDTIRGATIDTTGKDNLTSFLSSKKDLKDHTFNTLQAESLRLQKLIGLDKENATKLRVLDDRINKKESLLASQTSDRDLAKAAKANIARLIEERKQSYQRVFEGIVGEEQELLKLYEPLKQMLAGQSGTLGKLTFIVERIVDVQAWASKGEEMIDLRNIGPFQGRGTLAKTAGEELEPFWRSGSAVDVNNALEKFRAAHDTDLFKQSPELKADKEAYRKWVKKVGEWLYSTDHISIQYGIQYNGLDIKQLSPGTRGIVLLMMYLAIDQEDDRPLIIDQPEENLDPKSIYDELVPIFRSAKKRRQIIIVTHNANLVVNTDADQIIVASAGEHSPGQLPMLSYQTGGIENPAIRNKICEILEGGEAAFRDRAKRLRIQF